MTKDTRANLIFLCLFFAVALPGIYKLTMKAYKPGGRDPVMRRAVRGEFAYMDPSPPVGLVRVVPPGVERMMQRTAGRLVKMQPGLQSVVAPGQPPVMSQGLHLQVLAMGGHQGKFRVALFGWNPRYAPLPDQYEITATRGSETVKGQMLEYEPQNLQLELRSELQDYGYVVPPESVLWFVATFPGELPVDTIQVDYRLEKFRVVDRIDLNRALNAPSTQTSTAAVAR